MRDTALRHYCRTAARLVLGGCAVAAGALGVSFWFGADSALAAESHLNGGLIGDVADVVDAVVAPESSDLLEQTIEDQPGLVAEIVVSVAEPVVSVAEPVVSVAEPVVSVAEPVVTAVEPVIDITEPVVAPAADAIGQVVSAVDDLVVSPTLPELIDSVLPEPVVVPEDDPADFETGLGDMPQVTGIPPIPWAPPEESAIVNDTVADASESERNTVSERRDELASRVDEPAVGAVASMPVAPGSREPVVSAADRLKGSFEGGTEISVPIAGVAVPEVAWQGPGLSAAAVAAVHERLPASLLLGFDHSPA